MLYSALLCTPAVTLEQLVLGTPDPAENPVRQQVDSGRDRVTGETRDRVTGETRDRVTGETRDRGEEEGEVTFLHTPGSPSPW